MNQSDVRQIGINRGIEAATFCEVGDSDRKQAMCDCKHPSVCEDCIVEAAYEAELNSRQYSPFEVFARDLNAVPRRADGLWKAYERGIGIGIIRGSRKRLNLRPYPESKR
jgi:hypothetical protein